MPDPDRAGEDKEPSQPMARLDARRRTAGKRLGLLIGGGVAAAVIAGIAIAGMMRGTAPTPATSPAMAGRTALGQAIEIAREGDWTGLELEVQESLLTPQDGAFSHRLRIAVWAPQQEIEALVLVFRLHDSTGRLIDEARMELGTDAYPAHRPGDVLLGDHQVNRQESAPEALRGTLAVQRVRLRPRPATYPASPPLEVAYETPAPPGVKLAFLRRWDNATGPTIVGRLYHKIGVEVVNHGQQPVRRLHVALVYESTTGQSHETTRWLVGVQGAALMPGRTMLHNIITELPRDVFPGPRDIARVRVRVLEIE